MDNKNTEILIRESTFRQSGKHGLSVTIPVDYWRTRGLKATDPVNILQDTAGRLILEPVKKAPQ